MSLAAKTGLIHNLDGDDDFEPEVPLAEDPFRLGWRSVPRTLADGTVEYEEVPLTLEDLMFPEEYDRAMHHPAHAEDCSYLFDCLRLKLAEVPRSRVLSDCRVDFTIPGVKPLGPDLAVFLDVPEEWLAATLEVGPLAVRPVLVVEVTSPDTRRQDLFRKPDYYYRAGIPLYVVVDSRYRRQVRQDVRLVGFRQAPDGYEPMPPDDQGRLWIEALGVWLAIEGTRVVCIDGPTGRPIEPFVGQVQARQVAEARAEVAEARVTVADARAEVAEATARAEAEARTRAEARAEAEAAARRDLEARLAALEEQLRRLPGGE